MNNSYSMTVNPRHGVAFELVAENGVAAIVTDNNSVAIYEQNGGTTLMLEVIGFANQQMAIGFAVQRLIVEAKRYDDDYQINKHDLSRADGTHA